MVRWKAIGCLLKETLGRWWESNPFRLGAALAYYTVFSLAPVVLIALWIAGLFFGAKTAHQELLQDIDQTFGSRVSQAIADVVEYSKTSSGGTLATIFSIIVILFGATSVFVQLQDSLNTIWGVKAREGGGILAAVKDRFLSFTIVLAVGFLLLVSLVFSAVLSTVGTYVLPSTLPGGPILWRTLNWLLSLVLITLLFALIYKLLPDVVIEWRNVWVGSAVTAFLFVVGKYLIGLYLGRSTWISAYGAAGSLVVVLLWVYYSSQIFLFGAAFTYVYAHRSCKPIEIKSNAKPIAAA